MKCLSIRQPWANAIMFLGKDIENRTWPTHFRGDCLIHAGRLIDRDGDYFIRKLTGRGSGEVRTGGIIGIVEIVDCVTDSPSRWFFGEYGFVLRNPRPLPFIPYKGSLGFFDVPDSIVDNGVQP